MQWHRPEQFISWLWAVYRHIQDVTSFVLGLRGSNFVVLCVGLQGLGIRPATHAEPTGVLCSEPGAAGRWIVVDWEGKRSDVCSWPYGTRVQDGMRMSGTCAGAVFE